MKENSIVPYTFQTDDALRHGGPPLPRDWLLSILSGEIIRDNNGNPEKGKYLDISTSQMLYGNYFFGKRKHQFFLTGGITNFLDVYRRKYPSETKYSSESQIKWNAGIGYQYSCKKTYFRLTVYCIRMPDPLGWFPEIIPWAGVSVGVKL